MSIGDNIRNRRKELNLTVEGLAKAIGKNRATVYRYENGDIESLPIDILEPLAKALKVTPADLISDDMSAKVTIPTKDVDMAYEKLLEIKKSIHDIPVNHEIFTQAMKQKGVTIDGLAMLSGIDLKVIEGIAYNTYPFVNFDELGKLNKILGDVVDWKANAIAKDTFYKNIMTSLLDIQPFLGNTKLTDDEINILTKYRSSDELTQAMVKRTLGIG